MNVPHIMSKADFARHIGKSDSYVSKLDRQGRLVKDTAGLVMVAQSVTLIHATRDPGRGGDRTAAKTQAAPSQAAPAANSSAAAGQIDYNEAARREKIAKARTAELEQGEAAGALLRRDTVERVIFTLARMAMEALRNVAPRIAGQLAAESDPRRCEQIVEMELREVCQALAQASVDDRPDTAAAE